MPPDAVIGLSLPLAYLLGDPSSAPAGPAWQAAFGNADQGLSALRSAGVSSVELRSITQGTDPELALRAARRVWEAGLQVTVHGYLPKPPLGQTFADLYPPLLPLAEALSARGGEGLVTVHCYPVGDATVEETAERTAQALGRIAAGLEREQVPLRIALENDRLHGQPRPGATYGGILNVIDRVASPRLGACWDFGHAQANVQQGYLEQVPPAAYLQRVIHTHIHDLAPRTHCPLTCGVVPFGLYVDLLLASGYAGAYNLELNPERFGGGDAGELVCASIERLTAHLGRRTGAGAHSSAP